MYKAITRLGACAFIAASSFCGCGDDPIDEMPTADYSLSGEVIDQVSGTGIPLVVVRFSDAPIGTTSVEGAWSIEGREMPYCPRPQEEICGVEFQFPAEASYRDTTYIPTWTQIEPESGEYRGHFVSHGIEIVVEPQ